MKKLFLISMICFLLVITSACGNGNGAFKDKKTITIGMNNYTENIAYTYVWKQILEDQGYKVRTVFLEKAGVWVGTANDDIDISFAPWLPTTDAPFYKKYKDQVNIEDPWLKNARLGFAVPAYMKDVNTTEDLAKVASDVDNKVIGIDPGSSINGLAEQALKDYNLKSYTLVKSSEAAMLSELRKAYDAKRPIVVTMWNPHWAFADFDIKYLKDPKNSFGDPDNIYTMTSKEFKKTNPQVIKWMNNAQMNDKLISPLLSQVEKSSNPEEAAQKWVKKHKKLIDSWTKE
ncbi:glycine betaine ABC transporter substrate-binding protein [Priestia aryabhattai]|uniref:glycine betaine ABC transporter substrate-binding protein n=1 Tax=Priestia TaxID=2800373 RepID=UPI0030EF5167